MLPVHYAISLWEEDNKQTNEFIDQKVGGGVQWGKGIRKSYSLYGYI